MHSFETMVVLEMNGTAYQQRPELVQMKFMRGRKLKLFTRVNTGVLEKMSVNRQGLSLSYITCNK